MIKSGQSRFTNIWIALFIAIMFLLTPASLLAVTDDVGNYDYVPESPNYLKAVEKADGQVGQMIQAVKDRSGYEKEDWLIIITTDHGGSDFGHGKDIPEHRNIFFILTGEKVQKGNIELNVNVVDVALTAMKHLGVKINPDWNLDGKAQ